MNIYCVYTDSKKNQTEALAEPLIIKQGFSLYAAIFNFFWALYHRMWFIAFFAIFLRICAMSLEKLQLYYLYDVAILFIFGFFASDFRDYYALKSGFTVSDIIIANNEEEAELRYYHNTYKKID